METIQNILQQPIIEKLGWTLIHFLWQGTILAILLAITLRLLRRRTSNARYLAGCMTLLLMVILPIVTMQFIEIEPAVLEPIAFGEPLKTAEVPITPLEVKEVPLFERAPESVPFKPDITFTKADVSLRERFVTVCQPLLPFIVMIYFLGVFGLSIWNLGGWCQLQRLRRLFIKPVNDMIISRIAELSRLFRINRAVEVFESRLVAVPTVIGSLKPVILLPAAALSGLSAEQFEAILAHELAHIKRYDYLVNLIQTVVEILGFYHPAVWWVSNKIRAERENCCDDLAVKATGDSVKYAKALTLMEELRSSPQLAVAASGGSLFKRILRLLERQKDEKKKDGWLAPVVVTLLIAILAISAKITFTKDIMGQELEDLNVEKVLEKVRRAENPAANMKIEWVREHGSGGGIYPGSTPPLPEDMIRLIKFKGSAIIYGIRSRLEESQELYFGNDANEPGTVVKKTYVFDGTENRNLENVLKMRTRDVITHPYKAILQFGNLPPEILSQVLYGLGHHQLSNVNILEKYFKYTLIKGDEPGILILDSIRQDVSHERFTIDKNKDYNIIKIESIIYDGRIDYEENITLKKYPEGFWFVSERERIRYGFRDPSKKTSEERLKVTNVQFNIQAPADDTFNLQFPKGAMVADLSFNYNSLTKFSLGCLSEPNHTQEDRFVTPILDGQLSIGKPSDSNEVFGSVKECVLNNIAYRKDCFIDFDTGNLFSLPDGFQFYMGPEQDKWFEEKGIDAKFETGDGLNGLWTLNTKVIPVSNKRWDSITPEGCNKVLDAQKGIYPPIMSAEGKLPATFLFQTFDNRGILQIIEVGKNVQNQTIKIRYKLLQSNKVKPSILHGQILDPNGKPISNTTVSIREVGQPGQSYLRSPNILSDEDGYYIFDEIEWPYRVGAVWYEDLPDNKGQLHQYKGLNKILNGGQTINILFDKFPSGNSTLSGQLADQYNEPVKDFTVDLRLDVNLNDYSSEYSRAYGYSLNFSAPDGKFIINNVPEGQYQLRVSSQTNQAYVWPRWENVTIPKNSNLNKTFKITKRKAVYGRLLFEDGTPAILGLDSRTSLYIMPLNMPSRAGGGGGGVVRRLRFYKPRRRWLFSALCNGRKC